MAQSTKLVFISVNGTQWRVKSGATINTGGFKRESVNGVNSFGFTKEPMEATIECEVIVNADTRLDDYDLENAKVVAQTDTGQQYIMNDGWTEDPPTIDDGVIKRTIKGSPLTKDEN